MGQVRNNVATVLVAALGICLATVALAEPLDTSLRPAPRPGEEPPAEATLVEVVETVAVINSGESADVAMVVAEPAEAAPEEESPYLLDVSRLPKPRPATLIKGHEFRLALAAARQGRWGAAKALALADSKVAGDVIEWQRLRGGLGTFEQYRTFLSLNGDWPGLKLLRRKGEASIAEDEFPREVIAYFEPQPPQTGTGALRLAISHGRNGNFARSRAVLIDTWRTMKMSGEEETEFLARYSEALAPYHAARLSDALWREDRDGARRMKGRVAKAAVQMADVRLAFQTRASAAEALWKELPDVLKNDGGVARDRMQWLVAKKRRDDAASLIIKQSTSAASLGSPGAWAKWRRNLARQEMRAGNHKRAYALASNHFLESGSDYADLEWLSGYIALRFLNRPADALTHFRHFSPAVFTPISLARAGYWEGRALEAMGETDAANRLYARAAKYQTSFYGLLAAEKIGAEMDPAMTGKGPVGDWKTASFANSSVLKAAGLFHKAGQQYEVTRFLRHLAEITPKHELIALGDYTLSLKDPYIAVRVGKQIANEGVVAHRVYYPLTPIGEGTLPVEEALALAIARRESEFFTNAVSGAGARGLMQLMPGTAQDMAKAVGVDYSRARLNSDPVYNATLGSAYLAYLIGEFGNNITLVSVGYNAGPHRSRRWTDLNGDPRSSAVDVVDWIEHIPFDETRNYVMRVAESLPVYRARLTGQTAPIRITEELKGR